MQDYYETLEVSAEARGEEIQTAFDGAVAARKARRQGTADLHAAYAVVGDPVLRRAYDLARTGVAAGDKLVLVRNRAVVAANQAKGLIPEIDAREVARDAWRVTLKSTVLVSGVTARLADAAAVGSRRLQVTAATALGHEAKE